MDTCYLGVLVYVWVGRRVGWCVGVGNVWCGGGVQWWGVVVRCGGEVWW